MANEKRLIDIDRLIRSLKAMTSDYDAVSLHGIINSLKQWPALDAVEVVRCKDCKHRVYLHMDDEIGEIGGCKLFNMAMPYDNFCSYGERKDNG